MICKEAFIIPSNRWTRVSHGEFTLWKETESTKLFPVAFLAWNGYEGWGRLHIHYGKQHRFIPQERIRSGTYTFGIDPKNGNCFLDTKSAHLACKFLGIAFIEPWVTLAKTIYHLALLGILSAAVARVRGRIDSKQMQIRMTRSCVDIFRVPVYGVALTAIAIAGIAVSLFSIRGAYFMREKFGTLENKQMWGEKKWNKLFHTIAPCMQPIANVALFCQDVNTYKEKAVKFLAKFARPEKEYTIFLDTTSED